MRIRGARHRRLPVPRGMSTPQIVGVVLIRNEDLFIESVVRNILDFCDRIHVADHQSTDGTPAILRRLAAEYPKIEYRVVDHTSESHDMIAGYAGTPTWVMGVDGDEVYDPERLARLRQELFAGKYDGTFKMLGNVLNIRSLDRGRQRARGYLAPPCRSVVKLYNFNAIEAWPSPCPERLHGGVITYRPGYGEHSVRALHNELDWDQTPLRCLHFCFTHRSSLDLRRGEKVRIRKGVGETKHWGFNLRSWLLSLVGREDIPYFKRQYYMRGPLVEMDVRAFRLKESGAARSS
jgi:glycosyltransferase involved in cell wall biosynthesis